MKKVLGFLVCCLLLAGGGYGYWWYTHQPQPDTTTTAPADAPPIEPAETADKPEVEAPPLTLSEVGCTVRVAAGWRLTEPPGDLPLLPAGTPLVVLTKPTQVGPLLLVARLTKDIPGETEPARYPARFAAEVRQRLAALDPPAVLQAESAPALPWLHETTWVVAGGEFGELGLPSGTGRFLCGVDDQSQVYLVVGFSADQASSAEVLGMLGSLASTAVPAEASEAVPAESVPAEAPPAESPES